LAASASRFSTAIGGAALPCCSALFCLLRAFWADAGSWMTVLRPEGGEFGAFVQADGGAGFGFALGGQKVGGVVYAMRLAWSWHNCQKS
jgi:hypothetical protein